jgi:uncharacterized protein (UPF0276 family)
MSARPPRDLGVGIGWREEIAPFIAGLPDLRFVEVIAENLTLDDDLPPALHELRERGVVAIPHGLRLSLGGAERPDPARLDHLAGLAERLSAPLVSEHLAFVRAEDIEAGHVMPVPRTREALDVVVENVRLAQRELPVPLALEHVAALVEWPDAEMDEAEFLAEVLDRTNAWLLLDVANLYANSRNHGFDAGEFLDRVPLERLAYVHVGGGVERDGVYYDSHTHPVVEGVLELLEELCARVAPPGVLLERDDDFPPADRLAAELASMRRAIARGRERREAEDRR